MLSAYVENTIYAPAAFTYLSFVSMLLIDILITESALFECYVQ